MSPVQIPGYVEDGTYASYLDRLLVSSLGVQAGVVGENDFKVSAGSGLQVNVEKGKGFVAQTNAIEESGNSFFNGLYNVLSSTESTPYNNVEVSSVNPQIAQIILRVYDVGELKISGQSYARLEWLNGTPNAGATKAHIEEGKSSEFGAATLPQSSLRLCYVVVPKNATISSEFELIDERPYTGPKLVINSHKTSSMAKPGELYVSEGSITSRLPKAVQGYEVGFTNAESATTLTVKSQSGNVIEGDFVTGGTTTEVKLLSDQHLVLRAISKFVWQIIAGEPKNENRHGGFEEHTGSSGSIIPSTTRPTEVVLQIEYTGSTGGQAEINIGGSVITIGNGEASAYFKNFKQPLTFTLKIGDTWSWSTLSGAFKIYSSYKFL